MTHKPSLGWLRWSARIQIEQVLAVELLVCLADGTRKSALDLSLKELVSLWPPTKLWATLDWIFCYSAAHYGFVDLGDGELRHLDSLTLEDAPRYMAVIEANQKRSDAAMKVMRFIVGATQEIQEMVELGIGEGQYRTVSEWLSISPSTKGFSSTPWHEGRTT